MHLSVHTWHKSDSVLLYLRHMNMAADVEYAGFYTKWRTDVPWSAVTAYVQVNHEMKAVAGLTWTQHQFS